MLHPYVMMLAPFLVVCEWTARTIVSLGIMPRSGYEGVSPLADSSSGLEASCLSR